MKFERARTDQQIQTRKREIIAACSTLYDQYDFEGVNLKAIGEITSFSRSTIYNYYESKEEILLDLFLEDIRDWSVELSKVFENNKIYTKEMYCKILTTSFLRNKRLLRLMTLVYSNIEKVCSLQKLTEFKTELQHLQKPFFQNIHHYFPYSDIKAQKSFYTCSTALIMGLYPLTHPTKKQKDAMKAANYTGVEDTFEELCYNGLLTLANTL